MKKKLAVLATSLLVLIAGGITCNGQEMLQTRDFESGVSLPWHICESDEQNSRSYVNNDNYIVSIQNGGANNWDVQIKHLEFSIKRSHTYTVEFSVTSDKDTRIYAKIGDQGAPYGEVWNNNQKPYSLTAGKTLNVIDTFKANKDCDNAEFAFYLGGELTGSTPVNISFISMSLDDHDYVPSPCGTPTPTRDIRINQLGYFPNSTKKATFNKLYRSFDSVEWTLNNNNGVVVASGNTIPFGRDIAAGEIVQIIDFSSFTTPGKDYYLSVGDSQSIPFDIGTDMYSNMKYDALKYFYHARSGVEIKMPYCVNSKWARPAGHPNDNASLATGRNYIGPETINGTGGWYDTGDYGKYVVNGGLALWLLQNQYEYSKINAIENAFEDNKLNIPEIGNKINDLLDEARYEMEWMLKMQIPEGFDRAGMVIHKLTDEKKPELGTRPDQDIEKRIYYPPSTSATLNLTACAAQSARIWKDIDPEFSQRCLVASKTAYKSALENPAIFAPYGDELGSFTYGDNYVEDDFYWAACELYVTTGESRYLNDIKGYKDSEKMPVVLTGEFNGMQGCFDRCSTSGLGTLTLSLHKSSEFPNVKDEIKNAADTFIKIQNNESYGIPFAITTFVNKYGGISEIVENGYPRSSNAYVINEALLMAYAYDLSKDVKYINGLTESMDYLMGRNPLNQVYVSGYGENPVKNPNHLFFCPQFDFLYPSVPPGFLVGGPFSGGYVDEVPTDLHILRPPPQKHYLDDVEAWGINDVNVTYNASLAWVTNYLDAFGSKIPVQPTPTPMIPTPAPPTNTPFTITGAVIEDINKDGAVNMADVLAIAKLFGYVYSL